MDVILRFKGAYAFLSNFHPCGIVFEANLYPTLEHAYQAAKTDSAIERARIRERLTASAAKRLGRTVTLRLDWEDVKVSIMEQLIAQKFSAAHPGLMTALTATADAFLVEGNDWHDSHWGACFCGRCIGRGGNVLGQLLMARREQLQDARSTGEELSL